MAFVALTIAGSDPSGGAGLQADLKTFHQFGVEGAAVATLITVQNSVRVSRVELLAADLVGQQVDAVLEEVNPGAIKTGALGSAAVVEAVAARRFACALIVDPVMISTSGAALLNSDARSVLRRLLLPRAALVTPNLDEAAELAGIGVRDIPSMREAARRIADFGTPSVLVKGGHLQGDAVDILWHDGQFLEFRLPRIQIDATHTHGTGCTYSAAIAACLALGLAMPDAVGRAKRFVHEAIRTGSGRLNLFAATL